MPTIFVKEGTKLPERIEADAYYTPSIFVEKGLDVVEMIARDKRCPPYRTQSLSSSSSTDWFPITLDSGAGGGIWGEKAKERWPEADIIGVELRPLPKPEAYSLWDIGDYLDFDWEGFDLIIGNPPFGKLEAFVRHSLNKLHKGGILVFLTPLSFLQGKGRGNGLFMEFPPFLIAACKERPKFTGNNPPRAACFCGWIKGYRGFTELTWI